METPWPYTHTTPSVPRANPTDSQSHPDMARGSGQSGNDSGVPNRAQGPVCTCHVGHPFRLHSPLAGTPCLPPTPQHVQPRLWGEAKVLRVGDRLAQDGPSRLPRMPPLDDAHLPLHIQYPGLSSLPPSPCPARNPAHHPRLPPSHSATLKRPHPPELIPTEEAPQFIPAAWPANVTPPHPPASPPTLILTPSPGSPSSQPPQTLLQ